MAVFNQQNDEYDALGKTYAAKLRRMPATQRDIADKLINDVLFKGLQSNLTPSTFISDYGYTTGAIFVIVKIGSSSGRGTYDNVFAVQSSYTAGEIPSLSKPIFNIFPFF